MIQKHKMIITLILIKLEIKSIYKMIALVYSMKKFKIIKITSHMQHFSIFKTLGATLKNLDLIRLELCYSKIYLKLHLQL